ncbi:hypothetical protein [Spirosoma pomorum]
MKEGKDSLLSAEDVIMDEIGRAMMIILIPFLTDNWLSVWQQISLAAVARSNCYGIE